MQGLGKGSVLVPGSGQGLGLGRGTRLGHRYGLDQGWGTGLGRVWGTDQGRRSVQGQGSGRGMELVGFVLVSGWGKASVQVPMSDQASMLGKGTLLERMFFLVLVLGIALGLVLGTVQGRRSVLALG